MIAFEVKGGVEGGKAVIENVKLINLAVSLGGESLVQLKVMSRSGFADRACS